jgi:hypothetical protein
MNTTTQTFVASDIRRVVKVDEDPDTSYLDQERV